MLHKLVAAARDRRRLGRAGEDGLTLFIRRELARLDALYPTVVPELHAFLEHRKKLRQRAGASHPSDIEFLYDVLFFILFYVDDGGLATFDDPLFDAKEW